MEINMSPGPVLFYTIVVGLLTTIVWMLIGFRAMRAHERLADAVEYGVELARQRGAPSGDGNAAPEAPPTTVRATDAT